MTEKRHPYLKFKIHMSESNQSKSMHLTDRRKRWFLIDSLSLLRRSLLKEFNFDFPFSFDRFYFYQSLFRQVMEKTFVKNHVNYFLLAFISLVSFYTSSLRFSFFVKF